MRHGTRTRTAAPRFRDAAVFSSWRSFMSMNSAPASERAHIGFFGCRDAG